MKLSDNIELLKGDCLKLMPNIESKSVDLILCDLPFAITGNKWDVIIPFNELWDEYKRIIKDNGNIVLFGSQPFTSALIMSNLKWYKYNWVWDKTRGSNFQNAKFQPMKSYEDICVFSKGKGVYNPQYWYSTPYKTTARPRKKEIEGLNGSSAANYMTATISEDGRRYPLSILTFKRDGKRQHPTQKPVALLEYLIKTYTNEGGLVLDNCMGSCSTGVAAIKTNRKFIGIELNDKYFDISIKRISNEIIAFKSGT